ncbi:WcaI family glycosyltransferase [Nonlabens xiamenensis]|uniref:WcaI family glycosyltransferase n=1 Tax=Nonlabens xiamenensis TaxID=2341043 RepID=UPI0013DE1E84|nr:WcaI family glycosyltransferase [Nonlabens xiamenensis]
MTLVNKKITFISLNFYPEDTAIGLYSTQMVDQLLDAGASVNVVTAFPYYPQWKIAQTYQNHPNYVQDEYNNASVYRYKLYVPKKPTFLKRVLHILSFTKGSFFNLRKIKDADLVISIIPFTTSAWLAGYHARKHKAKSWIHIQDFEFDAALQSGVSNGASNLIFKFLYSLETRILNRANICSTISHHMLAKLNTKTNSQRIYLPNWIDAYQINPQTANVHPYLGGEKFKLLYSGNIGDKQDWEFFIAFAKALPIQHYDIIIVGAGSKYQALKSGLNQSNIHFYEPVPLEELSDLLCSADAHFLFQKTNVLDTVMPSKLLGMMASAKPSLIMGNSSSEVKTVVEKAQAGMYMASPDLDLAVRQLEQWRLQPKLREEIGSKAREYVLHHYSRKEILDRWINQLHQLLSS